MRLSSTFVDYYDGYLRGDSGPIFERVGGNVGPPKPEQFRLLEQAGYETPPHGVVEEVLGTWWEKEHQRVNYVVAYLDPLAHCTEGKEVWWKQCPALNVQPKMGWDPQNERSYKNYQTVYCSAFVGRFPADRSESIRRLQIGPHVYWIEYRSTESWMSNYGEGSCEVIGVEMDSGFHREPLDIPLFAIDFVLGREMYAVDLNTAPGIRGSGVENYLSPSNAARAIEIWYEKNRDNGKSPRLVTSTTEDVL